MNKIIFLLLLKIIKILALIQKKFYNEVNLSKINKIFGEELDENYKKNNDVLKNIFNDIKEVNSEFDGDTKGKKNQKKNKKKK